MPLFKSPNGLILKGPGGLPAGNRACCCPPKPACCFCPELETFGATIDVVITGVIAGTANGIPQVGSIECVEYFSSITLTDDCGGEFAPDIGLRLVCPIGGTSASSITCALIGGGGGCAFLEGSGVGIAPISASCGPPFTATYEFHTEDLFPGGCPCGEGLITVVVTQSP